MFAEPSDEVDVRPAVEAALQVLDREGDADQIALSKTLTRIAVEYVNSKWIAPYYRPAKEQMPLIAMLVDPLRQAQLLLQAIAPEYLNTIDSLIDQPADGQQPHLCSFELGAEIGVFLNALDYFIANFKPVRGASVNWPLEEAVRDLIPLLEEATGGRVTCASNKHKGEQPTLKSAEARAIGALLQAVDDTLKEHTVVNMIAKVRRQLRATPTQIGALMRFAHEEELLRH